MNFMFRSIIVSLFLSAAISVAGAQEIAVTETGDTVIIFMDGTWTYADGSSAPPFHAEFTLDTVDTAFLTPEHATRSILSDLGFFKVYYNPGQWKRIPPGGMNDEAEIALEGIGFDAYAVIISEEVEIGTANIFRFAIDNMTEFLGSQPDILASELRNVNGTDLIMGIFDLELNGLRITYHAYYYSSDKGTVQFTTWTGTNVYEKYAGRMEDLLNGLVVE